MPSQITDFRKANIPRWGLLWRQDNRLDGYREHLITGNIDGMLRPLMFHTREEARRYAREKYGYIGRRPDLKAEPHGWKPVKVVRIIDRTISYE